MAVRKTKAGLRLKRWFKEEKNEKGRVTNYKKKKEEKEKKRKKKK